MTHVHAQDLVQAKPLTHVPQLGRRLPPSPDTALCPGPHRRSREAPGQGPVRSRASREHAGCGNLLLQQLHFQEEHVTLLQRARRRGRSPESLGKQM